MPEPVLDLCVHDRHALAVTGDPRGKHATFRELTASGGSKIVATLETDNQSIIGVDCTSTDVIVLSTQKLVTVSASGRQDVELKSPPEAGAVPIQFAVSTLLATPDYVYLGINAGEWGGGLRRIDRRTGAIEKIERNDSGQLCDGPLNTDCDPVNALAVIPWKPTCIAAALGLVHMMTTGRIVEICGVNVRPLYSKRATLTPEENAKGYEAEEVPFFGLSRSGNALCAIGVDGLYRFADEQHITFTPLPQFKKVGPFYVSFALPDFVMVLTAVNERRSVGGAVPLLVPR
jgi:hypothetical protein